MPVPYRRLAACLAIGAATPLAALAADLPVGVVESLTGPVAISGLPHACGARIAESELAKEGRPKGYRLVLQVEDDQSKPATAVQAATKLTSAGVKHFVGGTSSFTVLAILPVLNDAGAFYTGGAVKTDELLKTGNVLRIQSSVTQDASIIADYVAKTLGAKKIAFVALQGAFAEGALAAIKGALPAGSAITSQYFVPVDTSNWQSVITSLANDKPDAVIFATFGQTQTIALLRQYKQANLGAPLVGAAGLLNGTAVQAAGAAADGVVSADIWNPAIDSPANKKFLASFNEFKGKHKECENIPLDKLVPLGYSELLLLAGAIEKANSVDPAAVRKTALANSWDLPLGNMQFEPNGQARSRLTLIEAKNGELTLKK
jgi:branched-chain amino acid transport system substrate-binding protein